MPAPHSLEQAALSVVKRLRDHGYNALFAGGCVRDHLLGSEPKDIDVATDATPDQVAALFRKTQQVGAKFGVVLVGQGRYWIETATFRVDLDYQDGRRPEGVRFTTAEEDAARRDFTINGLFYDPINDRVIDYVGGREDLETGIVRAIGEPNRRFEEDHLRLLRAVRFAARLGFSIDPDTAQAIRNHAPELARISAERIREELDKMLSHPTRSRAFQELHDLKLLPHLWQGAIWTPEQVKFARNVLQALPEEADFVIGFAAMLIVQPLDEARVAARELRCSNQQQEELLWLLSHYRDLDSAASMSLAAFKKLAVNDRFTSLLSLHGAFAAASGHPLTAADAARTRLKSIPPAEIAPPPLVTGDDLIALGLEPGPLFKRVLDQLYDAQLNNEITTREEALNKLLALVKNGNG